MSVVESMIDTETDTDIDIYIERKREKVVKIRV